MQISGLRIVLLSVGVLLFPSIALAQSACQKLDGEWAGSMSGRFAGPTSASLSNCRLTWKLPDGRTNYCDYTEKQGKLEYACSLVRVERWSPKGVRSPCGILTLATITLFR